MNKMPSQQLKIAFLGDTSTGKSTFIENYKSTCNITTKKKDTFQTLTKTLNNKNYILIVYEYNTLTKDKISNNVSDTCCVFIFFDMTERDSFQNILNRWIIWLRDTVKYKGVIFLMGNIINKAKIRITDEKEINELIAISGINAQYIEISDMTDDKKIELLDKLITEAEEKLKLDQKVKNCKIF